MTQVDAVIASRAARAYETAAAVAQVLASEVSEQTCDLCEMHPGQAEGMTYDEMAERFGPNYRSVPGAEYFPDWLPDAVRRLRSLAERLSGKTVVAITHSGVIKASFQAFGQMPHATVEAVAADNTGITEWSRPTGPSDPRRGVWSLVRHNDTAHLQRELNSADA
jgi:probable phosphoglycerate mutase